MSAAGGPAPRPGITIATGRPRPDVRLVALAGELDMATAPRVREQLRRQPPDPPVLVLDLTAVTFLGGAGITVVLEAAQAVPGGLQVVIAPDGPVRRAFRVTGVDRVLSLHADLDDALAAAALQD